jgi:hypothetical protein
VEAMPYLDYAIQNNTSGVNLGMVKELTGQVIALEKMAVRDPGNLSILKRIADAYSRMGNKEGAEKYTAIALKTQK